MGESKVAFDVPYYKGLDVVYIPAACGGVAHMAESHIALPESFEFLRRKDFGNKAVAFVVRKNAVAVDNYSAGFLPSVLKGVKPEINRVRYLRCLCAEYSENTAFFM